MLLRVDVYPTDWAPPSSQRDLPAAGGGGGDTDDSFLQPFQTLYACLASSSTSQDAGRVLTVGRKVGDVLLSSDKSVSREHMIVRLASVNKTHQQQQQQQQQDKKDNDDERGNIPPPLLATTPEQIQACQEDEYYHMCVLLENVGKLGSFVVRPAQANDSKQESKSTASAKNDDDSATDNDETDDEGEVGTQGASSKFVSPAAAGISLSTVTQLLLQEQYGTIAGATVRPIAMNEQIVLSELAQQHSRVLVQCGKQGSTLVISRHFIQVLRSGSRQGAAEWKAHDYQLGLLDAKVFDENTNLLVTPERNPSPKQLAAWCRHIPIVTSDYLQALLRGRKSPADPLFPDPSQYAPKDDRQRFWTTTANSKLLEDFTWISIATKEGDLEWMIRSAGASVLNIHDKLRDKPEKEDFLTWFREQVLKDREKPFTYCLGLADSKSRSKLYKEVLPHVLPDLPLVTPNTLAKWICDQCTPTADNGDALGLLIQSSEGTSQPASKPAAATTTPQENKPSNLPEGVTPAQQNEDDGFHSNKKRKAEDVDDNKKVARQRCATETPPTEPMEVSEKTTSRAQDTIDGGRNLSGAEALPEHEEVQNVPPPDELEEEGPAKESAADKTEETSRKRKKKTSSPPQDENDSVEDIPVGKRLKLAVVSESGWLQIAPKAKKKRRAYKCSREEIIKAAGYEEIHEVAVTEHCENLIVDNMPAIPTNPSRRRVAGPDYRAFRKNSIPRVPRVRVELRSVLPRETEQQREYEEQRQALEEQQRRVDELFRDPQGRSNNSRSRRR